MKKKSLKPIEHLNNLWKDPDGGRAGGDIYGQMFPDEPTGYADDWYVVMKVAGGDGFMNIFREPATNHIAVFRHEEDAEKVAGVLTRVFGNLYRPTIVNPHVVNAGILGQLCMVPPYGESILEDMTITPYRDDQGRITIRKKQPAGQEDSGVRNREEA